MKTKPKLTYAEMVAERERLDAAIAEARVEALAAVADEVRAVIRASGFSQRDVIARLLHGKRGERRDAARGIKTIRNPDTGETNRLTGRHPTWLKAKLAAGAEIDDFVI